MFLFEEKITLVELYLKPKLRFLVVHNLKYCSILQKDAYFKIKLTLYSLKYLQGKRKNVLCITMRVYVNLDKYKIIFIYLVVVLGTKN